jgi:hypothetical protein
MFPTQIKIFPYQRTMVLPYYAFAHDGLFGFSIFGLLSVVISAGLILIFVHQFRKNRTREPVSQALILSSLPMGMLVLFVLTVSIGRLSYGEPAFKLAENSNYGYVFWSLFLVTIYRAYASLERSPVTSLALRRITYALLTAAVALNFLLTLDVDLRRSHLMGFQKKLLSATKDLISQYGRQKDLSFSVTGPAKEFIYADWITKTDDPSRKGHVYLQLLYPEYYTDQDPAFIYTLKNGFQRTPKIETISKPAP